MSICLEIAPLAGSLFDGATFRAPSAFTFARVASNHYSAVMAAAGAVGVLDLRAMLDALETQFGNVIDKTAADFQNVERCTDLVLERAILLATAGVLANTEIGVHTPPLPGLANGVRDQVTPNTMATANVNVFRFGGSQFVSVDAAGKRGGVVTIPTSYRFFCESDGTNPRLLVWLIPIYTCCCWATWGQLNEQGAVPAPP